MSGDNVLTAISVARQCNLVNTRQRIYFGDLTEQKKGKKTQLIWKDFDFSDHLLNPDTLIPENDQLENDSIIESDIEEEKEDDLKKLKKKLLDQDKTNEPQAKKQSGKKSQSLVFSLNNHEKNTKTLHFKSVDNNINSLNIHNGIFFYYFLSFY